MTEDNNLVELLLQCDAISFCPRGRPTTVFTLCYDPKRRGRKFGFKAFGKGQSRIRFFQTATEVIATLKVAMIRSGGV